MKPESLRTLLVARNLMEQVREFSVGDDKYLASAALVVLQDAFELVMLAVLIEKGVEESKSLENLNFNELIGELKSAGVRVPKTGTLKAMHKERVIVKHHGQIAEPATVRNYIEAAQIAIDSVLQQSFGVSLREILIHEFLKAGEARDNIESAAREIELKNYFQALVHIRRALFIELETEYVVEDWKDSSETDETNWLALFRRRGSKAPWHTKKAEWIEKNVHDPFEFVQLDHERIRLDLIEWGYPTQDFWNLWRLTPPVYRSKDSGAWKVKGEIKHIITGATETNAKYCLEKATSLLIRKQAHFDLAKWIEEGPQNRIKIRIKSDTNLYQKASKASQIECALLEGSEYYADSVVHGFDEDRFAHIIHHQETPKLFLFGYVPMDDCNIEE